ncbi:MAG: AMP-binding protein [Caldilineaceae bacterium]|nr:AMP-binding protein [Caldilineaceae bacterium]
MADSAPHEALDLSENAAATLRFCRQWLSGQDAFVVNTSGSTGAPKPITLQRQQMETSARATGQALGLQAGQRALICLPTRYIAGRMMLVRGFVLGLHMTVVEPSSNPLAELPTATQFDFTALIPLQLQTILDASPAYGAILDRMQAILIGGGPVSVALHQQLQHIHAPIYHTYGMTETVTHIALRRLNGLPAADAFTPLPGVKLGLDERGCLTICGPVTLHETVVTNDHVALDADGSFVWLGRLDNVINSGGVKVQVEKVENALAQVLLARGDADLARRRFFVGALPDERLGQMVVVIMEGAPLGEPIEDALKAALKHKLDPFEIPRGYFYIPELCETPTGKIDRPQSLAQIADKFAGSAQQMYD